MINKIENRIMEIMRHYGFGDSEAAVMAILATHGKMTAKEIAKKTGYAYSTIINALNFLKRTGFVIKEKKNRICIYSTNLDFVRIIEEDRARLANLLKSLKDDIKDAEERYKGKLAHLILKIENALNYLNKSEVC